MGEPYEIDCEIHPAPPRAWWRIWPPLQETIVVHHGDDTYVESVPLGAGRRIVDELTAMARDGAELDIDKARISSALM